LSKSSKSSADLDGLAVGKQPGQSQADVPEKDDGAIDQSPAIAPQGCFG
jgi:hypothetical protein